MSIRKVKISELPKAGNINGLTVLGVNSNNESVYVDMPMLKGNQGIQGIQGLKGLTGAQGPQGIPGVPGPQGIPGVPGAQGLTGRVGVPGYPGQFTNIANFSSPISFSVGETKSVPLKSNLSNYDGKMVYLVFNALKYGGNWEYPVSFIYLDTSTTKSYQVGAVLPVGTSTSHLMFYIDVLTDSTIRVQYTNTTSALSVITLLPYIYVM